MVITCEGKSAVTVLLFCLPDEIRRIETEGAIVIIFTLLELMGYITYLFLVL